MTLPQAQFLVAAVIPHAPYDAAWVLAVLHFWQMSNQWAYRSDRTRLLARDHAPP